MTMALVLVAQVALAVASYRMNQRLLALERLPKLRVEVVRIDAESDPRSARP